MTNSAKKADDGNTIRFKVKTRAADTEHPAQLYPNIVDDHFTTALNEAKKGGTQNQAYFDAVNQTSDFWGWVAEQADLGFEMFVPGHDPDGNQILMASNGNLNLRLGAFLLDASDSPLSEGPEGQDSPPTAGIMTMQTANTTTNASKFVSFAVEVVSLPAGLVLSHTLFKKLLKPLLKNFATWVKKNATRFRRATAVEEPAVDVAEEAEIIGEEAAAETVEVGLEDVAYLTVDWTAGLAAGVGLGALVAIPFVISAVAHQMLNSVTISNQTDQDFTWKILKQVHGKCSVKPDSSANHTIPKMEYNTDIWGDQTDVQVAHEANFQFINSSDLGAIGYVLRLSPGDGGTPAKISCSIPWAGKNCIWVGSSSQSPQDIYDAHNTPDDRLTVAESFNNYTVSVSMNTLSGETKGSYYYTLLAVIEKTT